MSSECQVNSTALDQCTNSMNQFVNALRAEQDRRNAWQDNDAAIVVQNNTRATRRAQETEKLRQGHYAPNGYIWDGNTRRHCNSIDYTAQGPFNLCGYHHSYDKACQSCHNRFGGTAYLQKHGTVPDKSGQTCFNTGYGNYCHPADADLPQIPNLVGPCNSGSCGAEGVCAGNCSDQGSLKYNPNVSWYQGTYNSIWPTIQPLGRPNFVAIPIVAGDFLCSQCTQCVEFSNLTAGQNLTVGDQNQVQNCINQINHTIERQEANAAEAAQAQAEQSARSADTAVEESESLISTIEQYVVKYPQIQSYLDSAKAELVKAKASAARSHAAADAAKVAAQAANVNEANVQKGLAISEAKNTLASEAKIGNIYGEAEKFFAAALKADEIAKVEAEAKKKKMMMIIIVIMVITISLITGVTIYIVKARAAKAIANPVI